MQKAFFQSAARYLAVILLVLFLMGCAADPKLVRWFPFFNQPPSFVYQKGASKTIPFQVRPSRKNAEAYFQLGNYYQGRGNDARALKAFQKAIDIDPSLAKAYNGMGISFDNLKEFSLAESCYRKALELLPDSDQVYNNLGYSYLLQNKIELAIEAFNKAIAINTDIPRYHRNLQLALSQRKAADQVEYAAKEKKKETAAKSREIADKMVQYDDLENTAMTLPQKEETKPSPSQAGDIEVGASSVPTSLPLLSKASKSRPPSQELTGAMIQISHPESQKTLQREEHEKSGYAIEVVAGPDQMNLAANLTSYLNAHGVHAREGQGAERFSKTVVFYTEGQLQDAYRIAKLIPKYQDMQKSSFLHSPAVKIQIAIGNDCAKYFKKRYSQILQEQQAAEKKGLISANVAKTVGDKEEVADSSVF